MATETRRSRGSIIQRGEDPRKWTLVIDLERDSLGKRKRQWITMTGSRRAAEKRLGELLGEADSGLYIKPAKATFGEYLDQWLQNYAATRVRPTTLEGYRFRAKSVKTGLGNIRLADLRPDHLQGYYTSRLTTGQLAAGTLVKHHNLIREALATAVKWKLINQNIAEMVDPPRPSRKEMRALTGPEVHRVLEACQDTHWHTIFHTLIWTGLRRSELLGLRWKDVDLLLATLRVTQVLHQLSDGSYVYTEPKTAKAKRAVALSPASCLVLRSHREAQERDAASLGIALTDETLVFCHVADGAPLRPDTVGQAFRRKVRQLGLSGVRLHDLRHTMASLYLQMGISPKTVAERLGHSSVVITLDTYSHLLPGMQEAAAAQFDAAMEAAVPQTIG